VTHDILQPRGWPRPSGYANGIVACGRQVFIAGQVGWNASGQITSDRFVEQVRQALENILAILAEAGGRAEHVVRLTWYVTSRDEYLSALAPVGAAYRALFGRHFPAMSVVEVSGLVEVGARVEIEATAVIPDANA
jgi:enamine deaminase RidA (YjgF/YER057c/UK114 family)